MLALRLKNIGFRLSSLELNIQSNFSTSLGFIVAPTPCSYVSNQLVELQNHFKLLSTYHTSLKACIGQHVVDIGDVEFESRLQL